MLGSTLVFVLIRIVAVLAADHPTITPDEHGAWAVARYLSGAEQLISMRDMPHYSLIPGLLLVPIEWIGLGNVTSYRLALVLSSAMTLGAATLLRRTVQRVAPGNEAAAAAAFAMVLCLPAVLATGAFTWAEPTVLLWWALLTWGVARLALSPAWWTTTTTSVVAGLAPFAHGRLSAVPVLWVAALVGFAAADRRVRPNPAGARAGVGVALTLATWTGARSLDQAVARSVWEGGTASAADRVGDVLGTTPWWKGLGAAVFGQGWLVLASTAGLALVGAWWFGRQTLDRSDPGRTRFAGVLALMLASSIGISLLVGASGLSALYGGPVAPLSAVRWDHVVHGRYLDAVAVVLAVFGVVALLDVARARSAVRVQIVAIVSMVVTAATVQLLHGHRELADSLDLSIAGVAAVWPGGDGLSLLVWTLWPVAVATAFSVAATRTSPERRSTAVCSVLAVWLVVGALGAAALVTGLHRDRSQPDLAGPVGAPRAGGDLLVVADDVEVLPRWRLGVMAQQRDLTDLGWQVEFDRGDSDELVTAERLDGVEGVVLVEDADPPTGDGWRAIADFGGATIWRR